MVLLLYLKMIQGNIFLILSFYSAVGESGTLLWYFMWNFYEKIPLFLMDQSRFTLKLFNKN